MSTIQLVYDPIKQVKTITKTKNGCTVTETQTEYLIPYDCREGDKMILFLKDAAKVANAGGVIVGNIITRTYEGGQYKYYVNYADNDLAVGTAPNTLTQCDILKVCCYDCIAEYNDLTSLTSVDAGCGIVVNSDGEFEANVSGTWGEGDLIFGNGDVPFTEGSSIFCGDDGQLRGPPGHTTDIVHEQYDSLTLPATVSITLTNPSGVRTMRYLGATRLWTTYISGGAGPTPPEVTCEATLDGDNLFGPSAVGIFNWDSGNPLSGTFFNAAPLGYNAPKMIELEPGETKTLVVSYEIALGVGDSITTLHFDVDLLGVTL